MRLPLHHLRDSLYRSALIISLSSVVRSAFGFLFWLIAARLYALEEVGVASAVISSLALVVSISRLGLDQSLTRFIPSGNRDRIFVTSVVVTTLTALAIGIGLVLSIDFVAGDLGLVKENWLAYLIFVASSSIVSIELVTFIALRKSEFGLLQSLLGGSRVLFLIPLAFMGAMGVVTSELLGSIVIAAVSAVVLVRLGFKVSRLDASFLKGSFRYSAGNYIAGLTAILPVQIMPLMIMGVLGPAYTATFYLSFMLFQLLLVVPNSASTSLFVEGSHGVDIRIESRKTIRFSFLLLTPLVCLMLLFGRDMLGFIGSDYVRDGLDFLMVISLSSYFVAITSTYFSVLKIANRVKDLAVMSALLMSLILLSSLLFVQWYGIVGVGYSWLLSYGIFAAIAGCRFSRVFRESSC